MFIILILILQACGAPWFCCDASSFAWPGCVYTNATSHCDLCCEATFLTVSFESVKILAEFPTQFRAPCEVVGFDVLGRRSRSGLNLGRERLRA